MPGGAQDHLPPDKREEIQALVEQMMLRGAFTMRAAQRLAKIYSVHASTIYRYQQKVQERWLAEWKRRPGLLDTVDWQQRIRAAEALAHEKGDVKALGSLLRTEARVLGIEKMRVELEHSGHVDGAAELGLAGIATEKLEQALDVLLKPAGGDNGE